MTLNVGVVGVGKIGQEHIRRLTETLAGARVVAVSDADAARADEVAASVPGAKAYPTGEELIAAKDVDAVIVTSWGDTHAAYVIVAIRAANRSSARSRWRRPKRIARRSSMRKPPSEDGSSKSDSCAASMRNTAQ